MVRDPVAVRSALLESKPQRAAGLVAAVGAVAAVVLAALGLGGVGVSGVAGRAAFVAVFWLLPGVAGFACAGWRFGYPAAAVSGLAPGFAFLGVVTVGAAVELGGFGGGDTPLFPFALLLATIGFVWATAGFAAGLTVATLLDRL